MTRSPVSLPRFTRWLWQWSATRLGMAELADDAAELFVERVRTHGERAARRWYRRQAWSAVARLLERRTVAGRRERLTARVSGLSLDVKLGTRMLAKYPGLSLVAVVGMSVAIAIGAGGFGLIHSLVDAPLPLAEGERVVSLQNSDVTRPGSPNRHALHDFLLWRSAARSVVDLSAFLTERRNLSVPGGTTGNVEVAAMTASGFEVARVAPTLGRHLQADDERPGAAAVIVIAHEEWRDRFAGDAEIIGRTVLLDTVVHTVVGVMPAGFRFPVQHRYWVPLRLNPNEHEVGSGPAIQMFGRLADGATLAQAQAELSTLGRRMAAAYPQTHEHLRPWVRPYTHPFVGIDSPARAWLIRTMQLGLGLLLVVVAMNVAVLVYARTAARTGEIAVRTALGASRRRVVTQLFVEALMLSATASLIGLAIANFGFGVIRDLLSAEQPPFWVRFGLSPSLVMYVAGMAVLAAAIVGVVPALKVTGRAVHGSLQQLASRSLGMRLGRTWTTLIVVQVAIAVAILPYALYSSRQLIKAVIAAPDYPVDQFLRASFSIDRSQITAGADSAVLLAAGAARFAASIAEIERRLSAEPEVAGVTFATSYPGASWDVLQLEVEGIADREWVWINHVDIDLFDVFDAPILAGRDFVASDAMQGSTAVIVDRSFVQQLVDGGPVLGRRVREWVRMPDGTGRMRPGPWREIVGVVPAFTPPPPFERVAPKLYQPLDLMDAAGSVQLAVRVRRGIVPATMTGRIREISHAVDSSLRMGEVQTAAEADRMLKKGLMSLVLGIIAITGSVLLLSAAGIYAMMSFTVASRRREIGIRAALGAAPRRLMASIFQRAGAQLGAGVLSGLLLAELVVRAIGGGSLFVGDGILLILAVVALMLTIGLLAAFGPARRGLAVQPTEALRAE